MANKQKIIVIVGPTAVGKTSLSVTLAQQFNGEIISGDSLQIYRELDVGTAKATPEEQQGIPHFLIDEINYTENYSVSQFQQSARKYIEDIASRGHVPIIVGGTGLYIQSLLFDFELGGKEENTEEKEVYRKKWEILAEKEGYNKVWEHLNTIDSPAAATIHPNNLKRVIRAIEIKELTGESITNQKIDFQDLSQSLYDVKLIGLTTERSLLYDRINLRVEQMMSCGMLEEAKLLSSKRNLQSAQGIGYKEFFPYFDGKISLETAVQQVQQNSRRYAKRQLTWFRNRMPVEWWDIVQYPDKVNQLIMTIGNWLEEE